MSRLPDYIAQKYDVLRPEIRKRLKEFASVPRERYFYELCFCLCTPQSKAAHALIVQNELERRNFLAKPFNPVYLLRKKENYIRFHNTKAKRLLSAQKIYDKVEEVLISTLSPVEKRDWIVENIDGIGMKEASHFLRNIGYRDLAILDRHILKHLVLCDVYREIPKITGKKRYLEVENEFKKFAKKVKIPIDELDLLSWSYETGKIIK